MSDKKSQADLAHDKRLFENEQLRTNVLRTMAETKRIDADVALLEQEFEHRTKRNSVEVDLLEADLSERRSRASSH